MDEFAAPALISGTARNELKNYMQRTMDSVNYLTPRKTVAEAAYPANVAGDSEPDRTITAPVCVPSFSGLDLSWRAISAEIPKKYLGIGFSAWFGGQALSRQYFTNIWMLATANPKLRVVVFHDEKQASSDSVQRLFAGASCPKNILPVCAPCFLQANPESKIHNESKRYSAHSILGKYHQTMGDGDYTTAKDALFDYISAFTPEEVFPERSDCSLSRGWVHRVYFDLDFMCGIDLVTNMHDILDNPYRSQYCSYEMAKCAIWGGPGEFYANLSFVMQVDYWRKAGRCMLRYYTTAQELGHSYFMNEPEELTLIRGLKRLSIHESLTDFQHRRSLQSLFDSPTKGLDIVDSCAYVYNQKNLDWPFDTAERLSITDVLKSAITLHEFHQINEIITRQPLCTPMQEELISYCVNTSNTEALVYLYAYCNLGDVDTITRHLPATLKDHNTLMTNTLLRLGARLHSDVLEKALAKAVKKFQLDTIEYLLGLIPDADIDPQLLDTVLMKAIEYYYIPMADWLLARGAKIPTKPGKDYLFSSVAFCDNVEIWDWLHAHGLQTTPANLSECLYGHILRESDNEHLDWLADHGATADKMPEENIQIVQWNHQNDCLAPRLSAWLKQRFPDFLSDDPVDRSARCQEAVPE